MSCGVIKHSCSLHTYKQQHHSLVGSQFQRPKAAYLNQQRALSLNDKNEWHDVQILIVDEVSFMSDKILEVLDVKLKEIGNRAKPFGGFSIIFARDFRQLEPVGSTEFDLVFSSLSSKHWDNCINAIIIIDKPIGALPQTQFAIFVS